MRVGAGKEPRVPGWEVGLLRAPCRTGSRSPLVRSRPCAACAMHEKAHARLSLSTPLGRIPTTLYRYLFPTGTAKPHHVVVDPDHPDAPPVAVVAPMAAATGTAGAAPVTHGAGAGSAQGGGNGRTSGGGALGGGGGSGGVVLGYSHLGMLAAARWLLKQVTPLLRLALAANPGYQLRIVGECVY